ncbi:MAG: glutamate 5-kinase [Syntrophales bacterium]|jgi:glutamate 5-kinase|nr:glutamate 5-kinase [Syntrophales bacterium]
MTNIHKDILQGVKKVIVKVGSAVLTGQDGLDFRIIEQLTGEISGLIREGYHVVLVTSGAIASGKHRMGITTSLRSIPQKQAAAAIGQGRLMRVYSNAFGRHQINVAQILLTMSDLTDRKRFLNIRHTLSTLLEWGVIPIINENDTVAVEEIKFGDNDNLAAMIANATEAHLVINLTMTEGLFDRDPGVFRDARRIPVIHEITEEIEGAASAEGTAEGSGGMRSKVLAAKKVTLSGIPYIIAQGKKPGVLGDIFAGKDTGTLFLPAGELLNSRKYWIAFTLPSQGRLTVDEGAQRAIIEAGKSLLPSGIAGVDGDFEAGDPVTCVDPQGGAFAKGLVNYGAAEIRKIMGIQSSKISEVLGYKDYDEVIHRDNMAVMEGRKPRKTGAGTGWKKRSDPGDHPQ